MKKLLSAVLSCVMLFGLMIPMTVSAETAAVTVDGVTRIEMEDYLSLVEIDEADGTPFTTAKKLEGGVAGVEYMWIDTESTGTVSKTYDIEIPVTVAKAGNYIVKYVYSDSFSGINFLVDSATKTVTTGKTVADTATFTDNSTNYFNKHSTELAISITAPIALTAASHTVGVRLTSRATNDHDFVKALDYIEIIPEKATVSATESTTVDLEDYVGIVSIPYTRSDGVAANEPGTMHVELGANLSDNAMLCFSASNAVNASYTFSVDVNVPADGVFNFAYKAGKGNQPLSVYLDGKDVTSTASGDEDRDKTHKWNTTYIHSYATNNVYLAAGDHTVSFTVSRSSSNGIAKILESFTFTPVPETVETVNATETKRIEAENYNYRVQIPRANSVYSAELGTTGTGWSGTGFMKINSDTATVSTYDVTIPVNVAVAGDYKVKVVMTATTSHSAAELLVNGAVVSTTYTEKAGAEYFTWHSSPAGEYATEGLTLNSGRNTVGVRLTYRDNLYDDFVKGIDYFEIIPATPVVSSTVPTTIEAEDHLDVVDIPRTKGNYTAVLGTTGTGWSGTGFMMINSDTATVSTYDVTIPVNVAVAGNYKVEVVMTATTSHSAAELLVNGAVVSTTYTEKAGEEYFNWHSSPAGAYTTGMLELNSGRNTVGVRLTYRDNLYDDFVKGIDYFKIIPTTPVVSSTEPTRIEAEDYNSSVQISREKGDYTAELGTTGTGWSGTGFMKINSDTATVTTYDVTIPVNVAEAGNYKVKVVMTTQPEHSAAELLVNGAVVSTTCTEKAGTEYFNWHSSTAGEYATGVLTLNSGRNTVGVRLTYRENVYQDFVRGIDYFEIVPAAPVVEPTSGITYADGKVSATYVLDDVTSGTVLLVLYNGKEFVGVVPGSIADGVATAEYATTAAFTEAKLFVWADATTTYAPLVAPLTEDNFAN